jgi:DNA-binding SARP family transcriptional activator
MGIPTFTRRYFENLYARLKPPFVLVFDNCQDVPTDSGFYGVIQEGLSIMPRGITVILISRNEPPQSFVRARANNKIFILEWSEMRLTLEESREIVKLRGQSGLPEETLAQLHTRADGWAAGLVLMTEAFKTAGIGPRATGISTPQELFDYFAGEVIDKLDGETRDFLLMSSFLPAMTVQTANELTGQGNAGLILSTLNRNRMFTEKHSTTNPTYRYHPLFREFLLARMKELLNPEELLRVQTRAAAVLEEAGLIEDAASIYQETRNWERFIPLILGHAQTLIIQGRGQTLKGWIESLPEDIARKDPWLLYWSGACSFPFSPPQSRLYFEEAFGIFKNRRDAAGVFLALCGMFEAVSFSLDRFAEFDRLVPMLYQMLDEYKRFPSQEIEAQMVKSMLYAIVLRQPWSPDFAHWEERALSIAKTSSDVNMKVHMFFLLALYRIFSGEFEKGTLLVEALREVVKTFPISPLSILILKDLEAFYYWQAAEFDECRKAVAEGIALAETSGIHGMDAYIAGHGAAGALSSGDMESANEYLQKMASLLGSNPGSWGASLYHNLSAWRSLLQGDRALAAEHADLAVKFGNESGSPQTEAYHHLTKAIVIHELKRDVEALEHLSEVRRLCRDFKTYQAEFRCLLAEAQFAFDRGDESSGMDRLRSAMALGGKHGYMNTFFWIPSVMARLCVKALEAGIEVEYVQGLVRKRNLVPETPPLHLEAWPWPVKIYSLGRFVLFRDGKPVTFSKKIPRKPIEMLKVLVALGGQNVSEMRLNDILWPDADGDSAHQAFRITLFRLRDLIGRKEAVELRDGFVTLDKRYVWTDAWALEYLLNSASAEGGNAPDPEFLKRSIELYTGPFLADENGSWAVSLRERLRGRVIDQIAKLGRRWEEKKMFVKAIDCYLRGLDIDDLMEEFYRRAILCSIKLGRRAEALSLYHRCEKVLGSHGIKPSQETATIRNLLIS